MAYNLISHRSDIKYVNLSKNIKKWTEVEKSIVEGYGVFDLLKKTAPILVNTINEKKYIGFLSIKKAVNDGEL